MQKTSGRWVALFAAMELCGVLFAQSSAAYTYTRLHSMGGSDGATPTGGLIMDSAGNLYGSNAILGAHSAGTVFRLSPPAGGSGSWTYTVLYDFCATGGSSCTDGSAPVAGLILDTRGNLYGTAQKGGGGLSGTAYNGVVFQLSPTSSGAPPWNLHVLHAFCPTTGCADGYKPDGRLTYAGAQSGSLYNGLAPLYSTAERGGPNGLGAVFRIKPNGSTTLWSYDVLYSFLGISNSDGEAPTAAPIMDGLGALYGTAGGGEHGGGIVYKLVDPGGGGSWSESILYPFAAGDTVGYGLLGEVSRNGSGNLLGMTFVGGTGFDPAGDGTFFSVAGSGGTATPIYNFCTSGSQFNCTDGVPANEDGYGPIIDTVSNSMYGMTQKGGSGGGGQRDGVVFRVSSTGTYTVLYNFCSQASCTDGATPNGGLIRDGSGNFYGVTELGGDDNHGTVFELSP